MDEEGNYTGMERFMPNAKFYHPMDMTLATVNCIYWNTVANWFVQMKKNAFGTEFNPVVTGQLVVKVTSSIDVMAIAVVSHQMEAVGPR
jgi:cytochrome c